MRTTRRISPDRITQERLEYTLRTCNTTRQAAERLGCTLTSITAAIRRFGLPYKTDQSGRLHPVPQQEEGP